MRRHFVLLLSLLTFGFLFVVGLLLEIHFWAGGVRRRMVERLDVNLLEMRALEVQTLHRGVTLTVNAFGVVDGTVVITIFEFDAVYSRLVCIMLFLFVGFFNNGIHMHRRYVFTLNITIVICLRYLPVVLV